MHALFLRNTTPQFTDSQIFAAPKNRGNVSPNPPLEGEGLYHCATSFTSFTSFTPTPPPSLPSLGARRPHTHMIHHHLRYMLEPGLALRFLHQIASEEP